MPWLIKCITDVMFIVNYEYKVNTSSCLMCCLHLPTYSYVPVLRLYSRLSYSTSCNVLLFNSNAHFYRVFPSPTFHSPLSLLLFGSLNLFFIHTRGIIKYTNVQKKLMFTNKASIYCVRTVPMWSVSILTYEWCTLYVIFWILYCHYILNVFLVQCVSYYSRVVTTFRRYALGDWELILS